MALVKEAIAQAVRKAAVTPVQEWIASGATDSDFIPSEKDSNTPLNTYHLRKLIKDNNWRYVEGLEFPKEKSKVWCECVDIDNAGHERGWKFAKDIDTLLEDITVRIDHLQLAGCASLQRFGIQQMGALRCHERRGALQ